MNFAGIRLVVCCTPNFFEYWRQRNQEYSTNTTSRMPNSKVHVLYLNEYWSDKEIRSTSLTQQVVCLTAKFMFCISMNTGVTKKSGVQH